MKKEKKKPETEETAKVEDQAEKGEETAQQPEQEQESTEPTAEEKLTEELKAEKDKYLRLYAEYENYRKRTSAEKLQIYDDATARAIKELLPLADSMTNALSQFEGRMSPKSSKRAWS